MRICPIDFETTGFNAEVERITEIGAICYDTEEKERQYDYFSYLVWDKDYAPLTPEIVLITGITDEMLRKEGVHFVDVINGLMLYFEKHGFKFLNDVYFKDFTNKLCLFI
jgi:DNA polymerase III epsilon subunit-like protein